MQTCLQATKSIKIYWNSIYKIRLFVLILVLKLLGIFCNVIYTVDYNELLSKKRDLSDKSRDGEDSKKVKESDILSSLTDEVFSDGLNSPGLAKLLANCLKSLYRPK